MARCEGTTRSGTRCRLDARPGSRFCHLHESSGEEAEPAGKDDAENALELDDLVPLLLAGVVAAGVLFFLRSFGKWLPRL